MWSLTLPGSDRQSPGNTLLCLRELFPMRECVHASLFRRLVLFPTIARSIERGHETVSSVAVLHIPVDVACGQSLKARG